MSMSHYSGIPVTQDVADILEAAADHITATYAWTYLDDGKVRMDRQIAVGKGRLTTWGGVSHSVIGDDETDACNKMAAMLA